MKRTRTMAILLSASMLFSLTACKKNTDERESATSVDEQSKTTEKTNSDGPLRDYVLETDPYYTCEQTTILLPYDEEKKIERLDLREHDPIFIDEKIVARYSITYVMPKDVQEKLNNLDYSDSDAVTRQAEIAAEYSESGIAVFGYDGSMAGKIIAGKGEEFKGFCSFDSDKIALLAQVYDFETKEYKYWLRIYTLNGQCEKECTINIDNALNLKMMAMDDGNILLVNTADAYAFSLEGKRLWKSSFYIMSQCIFHKDGKYYIIMDLPMTIEEEYHTVLSYQEIDPKTGTLSERTDLNRFYSLSIDGENIYVLGSRSLSYFDLFSEQQEAVFTANDNDFVISEDGSGALKVKSEKDIYYITPAADGGEGADQGWTLCHIQKAATNPCAGKKILRVGFGGREYTENLIQAYNLRPESKARIVQYNTWSNTSMQSAYSKAEATMLDTVILDMKSGTGPDVLLDFADYAQLNTDDLLIDLNPYLDGSDGIDRSEYFDNIFQAFETDGKLYQIPLSISLDVLAANPDHMGDTTDWTCDQFLAKIQSLGGDVLPFLSLEVNDPMTLLIQLLSVDMTHYVDYSKGEAYFDSDDFRRLLEISKWIGDRLNPNLIDSLMEEYDDMGRNRETGGYRSTTAIVMEAGLCCAVPMNISRLRDYGRYADLCGGKVVVIGWPTTAGRGFAAEATSSVAISKFSNCKDEAWDFVRYLLSQEAQSADIRESGNVEIRICRASQEKAIEKTIISHQKELEKERQYSTAESAYVIDEAVGQKYLGLIERISTSVNRNPAVFRLVKEEAQAYFAGQKSADNVSKTVQNRVSTFLAETN